MCYTKKLTAWFLTGNLSKRLDELDAAGDLTFKTEKLETGFGKLVLHPGRLRSEQYRMS